MTWQSCSLNKLINKQHQTRELHIERNPTGQQNLLRLINFSNIRHMNPGLRVMRSSFTFSEIIDQYNSIDLCHLYKRHHRPGSLTAKSVMSKMASLALQPLSFACRRMSHNVLENMSRCSQRYNAPLISMKSAERTLTTHVHEHIQKPVIWLEKRL